MDNQKLNDGIARNIGTQGSGSSMGKDLGTGQGSGTTDINKTATEAHKTIDKAAEQAQPMADRLASSAAFPDRAVRDGATGRSRAPLTHDAGRAAAGH